MAVLHGNLFLFGEGPDGSEVVLAASTDATMTIERDKVDTSSKDGPYATHLEGGGLRTYSGEVSGFVDPTNAISIAELEDLLNQSAYADIAFGDVNGGASGASLWKGKGSIFNVEIEGGANGAQTLSFSFEFNGQPTRTQTA